MGKRGKSKYKHIPVLEPTYKEVCQVGTYDDTFDSIMKRLLENYNQKGRLSTK